ncbi:MAG: lipoprotein signal peptidase [Chlorobi bacterium]|nr:lipoprotein signal peptidase [Chlorobiota bacterium]
MSLFKKSLILVFLLLLIDQTVKIWIKTHFALGEGFSVFGNWAKINFVENPGMAFGLKWGGDAGKLLLSSFRLAAIAALIWYLYSISKKKLPKIAVFSVALILTGAIGNILDSAFYGLIFSNSTYHTVAQLFPAAGGYAGFLHGSVVDMFYFPMFHGVLPSWIPIYGGENFVFFSPVFNVADSCITIGVFLVILFRKRFVKD